LPLEPSLWLIVGMMIVVVICYAIYRFFTRAPRSVQLCIEVGNSQTDTLIDWINSPHNPEWYQWCINEV